MMSRLAYRLPGLALLSILSSSVLGHAWSSTPQTQLSTPSWSKGIACKVASKDGTVIPLSSPLVIDCSGDLRGASISCDGDGAEPLDAPLDTVCRTHTLPLQQAETVTIDVADPVEIREGTVRDQDIAVTWLEFKNDLILVATRVMRAREQVKIPVAQSAQRLVRFSRDGASPVTVAAKSFRENRWRLPLARGGGELLVHLSRAPVLPTALGLSGASYVEKEVHDNEWLSFDGIPPGDYQVSRRYAGGLSDTGPGARIDRSASSFLNLSPEQVGGAAITFDGAACATVSGLALTHVDVKPRSQAREHILTAQGTGECLQRIAGLPAGTYELTATGAGVVLPITTFTVSAQHWTAVAIAGMASDVHGQITVNGLPLGFAGVSFARVIDGKRDIEGAATDSSGGYSTALPGPGQYRVSITKDRVPLPGVATNFTAVAGANVFDWNIEGGILIVRLRGWDRRAAATVSVAGATDAASSPMISIGIRPNESDEITISPIGLGSFSVRARAGNQLSRQTRTATFDKTHAKVTVDLDLSENAHVLRVRDAVGNPVSAAQLSQPGMVEIEPGAYTQGASPPGLRLVVTKPGLAQGCRRAATDHDLTLTLGQSRSVVVVIEGNASAIPVGAVVPPDSDCPVRLSEMRYSRLAATGVEQRFAIQNFPVGDVFFFWQQTGQQIPFTVDADGSLHVKLPGGL